MNAELLVVTQSYPFGADSDFMRDEVRHLAEQFDRVVFVPTNPRGDLAPVPNNVEVDASLSPRMTRSGRVRSVLSRAGLQLLLREVRASWRKLSSPRQIGRLVVSVGTAASVSNWVRGRPAGRPPVVYSYWLTAAIVGFRHASSETLIFSRAHRGELFTTEYPGDYIPQQESMLKACIEVASVSDEGQRHLAERYPDITTSIVVRRLGVSAFPASEVSDDDAVRVVTCSGLRPVKRPLLIADVMIDLARTHTVEWDHYGDGPLREDLERRLAEADTRSLLATIHGNVANAEVASRFQERPVDLFLNLSTSEGVPVSIMEAASAGVPVLATDVGGTGEIVSPIVGRLLPADVPVQTVVATIEELLKHPGDRIERIRWWNEHYNEHRNYRDSSARLAEIVQLAGDSKLQHDRTPQ